MIQGKFSNISSSRLFWLVASAFIVILVYWRWFFKFGILTWGDWGFVYSETSREWFDIPQAWDNSALGQVFIGLSLYLPARLFYGILSQFIDIPYIERIIFLFPSVLVAAVSVFLLVYKITKNHLSAFVGSLVYNFNTHILLLNTGHLTLSTAFAISPLVFLLFHETLERKSLKFAIITGLAGFLVSSYEVRGFYLLAIILFLYFIYTVFMTGEYKYLQRFLKVSLYAAVPLVLVLLLNSYWLFAFLKTTSAYEGVVIGRQLINADAYFFPRNLLLFNPAWTGTSQLAWGRIQPTPLYLWLIPFLAFFGFWFGKKNNQIIFWTAVSLIGIFLLKITNEPFGGIYLWLFNNVPMFNAFREPSKFIFLIALGFSVLIGSLVSWLWKQKFGQHLKIALTVLIALLFLYNTRLVILGQLGKLLTPRHIPQDYLILKEFIQNQPEFFRILYLPHDSRWGYWDTTHPKLSTKLLVQNEWREINGYNKTGLEYSELEETTNIFQKPFADDLLDEAAIKYVVVPLEDKENEEAFIFPHRVSRDDYIKFLSGLPYLKLIDIGTKELVVFENEGYWPYFNTTPNTEFEVISKSPTKYELILKSTPKKPVKLHFSENYHSGWKARIGNFSWLESFFAKNYFLSDSYHKQSEFGLNEFVLPDTIKPGEKITLYFAPQAYVNLGLVISFITLTASLSLLLILWLTRRH